jgi:hypothetical protein
MHAPSPFTRLPSLSGALLPRRAVAVSVGGTGAAQQNKKPTSSTPASSSLPLSLRPCTVDCPCHGRRPRQRRNSSQPATPRPTVCTGCCDVLSDFLRLLLFRWNFRRERSHTSVSLRHVENRSRTRIR